LRIYVTYKLLIKLVGDCPSHRAVHPMVQSINRGEINEPR